MVRFTYKDGARDITIHHEIPQELAQLQREIEAAAAKVDCPNHPGNGYAEFLLMRSVYGVGFSPTHYCCWDYVQPIVDNLQLPSEWPPDWIKTTQVMKYTESGPTEH